MKKLTNDEIIKKRDEAWAKYRKALSRKTDAQTLDALFWEFKRLDVEWQRRRVK